MTDSKPGNVSLHNAINFGPLCELETGTPPGIQTTWRVRRALTSASGLSSAPGPDERTTCRTVCMAWGRGEALCGAIEGLRLSKVKPRSCLSLKG